MLTGFSREEVEPFSLPEDTGEPRTLFYVRSIPRGKLDELTAKGVDYNNEEKQDGDHVSRGKFFNREIVRWGIAKHEHLADERGREIPCVTVEGAFASEKAQILSDATLDCYERTLLRKSNLTATEDGPAGPDGAPLWKAGGDILATVDGPIGAGGEPKWRKGEPIPYEVTLLDELARRVMAEQTLSSADRRALPGAGVAAR